MNTCATADLMKDQHNAFMKKPVVHTKRLATVQFVYSVEVLRKARLA